MSKTTRKFSWEIYDKDGDFVDVLSMTRDEMKRYHALFPEYTCQEIEYADDGRDQSRESCSKAGRTVYRIRISNR